MEAGAFINLEEGDIEYIYCSSNEIIEPCKTTGFGGLYLGNRDASRDFPYFKAQNITVVLDVAGMKYKYPSAIVEYAKCVEAEDAEGFELIVFFEECFEFIHDHRSNGRNVFVHCMAGVSRSATIVVGYVMKMMEMDLKTAYNYVRQKRPCISPNQGFLLQLKNYEVQLLAKAKEIVNAKGKKAKGKEIKK